MPPPDDRSRSPGRGRCPIPPWAVAWHLPETPGSPAVAPMTILLKRAKKHCEHMGIQAQKMQDKAEASIKEGSRMQENAEEARTDADRMIGICDELIRKGTDAATPDSTHRRVYAKAATDAAQTARGHCEELNQHAKKMKEKADATTNDGKDMKETAEAAMKEIKFMTEINDILLRRSQFVDAQVLAYARIHGPPAGGFLVEAEEPATDPIEPTEDDGVEEGEPIEDAEEEARVVMSPMMSPATPP